MTTPQELTHDTLIALQIAYDDTEAQDDVRMLISGYRALQTRYREAVKVLEEIANVDFRIGTQPGEMRQWVRDFIAGKVSK